MNRTSRTIVGYALLLIGVFVGSYLVVWAIFQTPPPLPFISSLPFLQSKSSSTQNPPGLGYTGYGRQPKSISRGIAESDGKMRYMLRGKIIKKPFITATGLVETAFVVDGDPNNTKIRVLVTGKGGNMRLGIARGSLDSITYSVKPPEDFISSAIVGNPAMIQIIIDQSDKGHDATELSERMDAVFHNDWTKLPLILYSPESVAVVI